MTSFGKEVKPWVPCRRFTARKGTSSRNYSLWAKFVGLSRSMSEASLMIEDVKKCRKTQQQTNNEKISVLKPSQNFQNNL